MSLMQQSEPLSQGWHRGAIKDSQVAHGLSYYYYGETRRLSSDFIKDSVTAEDDDLQRNNVDNELALTEKAFDYLTRKTYPPGCSKNDKRVIRRTTEKH